MLKSGQICNTLNDTPNDILNGKDRWKNNLSLYEVIGEKRWWKKINVKSGILRKWALLDENDILLVKLKI